MQHLVAHRVLRPCLKLTIVALAMLAIAACGIFTNDPTPAPNPTPATRNTSVTESIPEPPGNVQYRRDGSTIVVTWDPSEGADHYKIYYDDFFGQSCYISDFDGSPSFCDLLDENVSGTSYTHTSPDYDTNHYWIVACDSAGCSDIDEDNPAQFIDNRPPAPANVLVSREGSSLRVSWDPSEGADHYKIYHHHFTGDLCRISDFDGSPSFCDLLDGNVSGTSYTHTSPDEDTNYYWITACNRAGCSEIVNRPSAVYRAEYRRDGSTIIVTWIPSEGADYYKIYYDDSSDSSCEIVSGSPRFCEELVGNVLGTTYTHTSPGEDIGRYWIRACNSAGCSDIDSSSLARIRPLAPTNVRVSPEGSSLLVSWAPSEGATHYEVYFNDSGPDERLDLLDGDVTLTSYTDYVRVPQIPTGINVVGRTHNSLTINWIGGNFVDTYYYYWVAACNSGLCSDISKRNPVSVQITNQRYQLSRGRSEGGGFALVESSVTDSTYVDEDLQPSSIYYYSVQSCNDGGCSGPSRTTGGLTESDGPADVPSTPTGFQGEKIDVRLGTDTVEVSWNAVEGATYYQVYQGSNLDAEVSAPQTGYRDSSPNTFLGAFQSTTYTVRACNKTGCSQFTESVTKY